MILLWWNRGGGTGRGETPPNVAQRAVSGVLFALRGSCCEGVPANWREQRSATWDL